MEKEQGDPEDYIGPDEEGEEHPLGHMEEPTSVEADEYVGPLTAEELEALHPES